MSDTPQLPKSDEGMPPGVRAADIPGNGKPYGYNCAVCGEPIVEPQPTAHTDEGLAHAICTIEIPPEPPEPSRLWQHMHDTHDLVLTQSELDDILSAAFFDYEDERLLWNQRIAKLEDALRHIATYPGITATAMRDCAKEALK